MSVSLTHSLKVNVQICIHTSSWTEHKRQRRHNTRGCALKLLLIFIHLWRAVLSQGLAQICDGVKSWPAEVNKSFAIDVSGLEFLLLSLNTWIAAWTSAEVVSKKSKRSFFQILWSAGEDNFIPLKSTYKLRVHYKLPCLTCLVDLLWSSLTWENIIKYFLFPRTTFFQTPIKTWCSKQFFQGYTESLWQS